MTSKFILVLGMALIAAPATAQSSKPAKTTDQTKYCIAYDSIVGSRVTKQECKTKEEWAKERVNVDRMLNK